MSTDHDSAREFLSHAEEFLQASQRLNASKPFLFHPTFYSALHSIELGLKTHLALAGFTKKQLSSRRLGHDLGALVNEAHEAGMVPFLDGRARKAIEFGGKSYSKKCFEYPESMASTLPIGRWIKIANDLTSHAKRRIESD